MVLRKIKNYINIGFVREFSLNVVDDILRYETKIYLIKGEAFEVNCDISWIWKWLHRG